MNLRRHLPTMALCSATVILSAAGGATAAGLIGSSDIENDSVSSVDIKDLGIKGRDLSRDSVGGAKVRPDSLTGADIDESTLDIEAAPTTPSDPSTPGDTAGKSYTYTTPFTMTLDSSGSYSTLDMTSQASIPARTVITPVTFEVTSPGCTNVQFSASLDQGAVLASTNVNTTRERLTWASTGRTADKIRLGAEDFDDFGEGAQACSGTATLTFATTEYPDGTATPFQ